MTHRAKARKIAKCTLQSSKVARTRKQFNSRLNGGAKYEIALSLCGRCENSEVLQDNRFSTINLCLPTSEEPTQNLCIATAGIPSGVTGSKIALPVTLRRLPTN
jgi:ABC-type uncharacterized transport system YnjBCD ATPase subunit